MKLKKAIRVIPFPNTSGPYFSVHVGLENVGGFQAREDGYVPFGCRKALGSIDAAAREVVWRASRRHIKMAAELSRASLELPVSADAVDPVLTSSHGTSTREKGI